MKLEYVYLLRVYPGNEKFIYKFGRTMRHFPERFKDYSAAKPTIILVLSCTYCKLLEKSTLDSIKENFTMRKDIGNEYFEGDYEAVKKLVINHYRTHVRKYKVDTPVTDTTAAAATDGDAINYETIINEHNYAALNDDLGAKLEESLKSGDTDLIDLLEFCKAANNKRFIRFLHDHGHDIFGPGYEYYFKLPQNIKQFYSTMAPSEISLQDPVAIAHALNDTYLSKLVSQESIRTYLIDCISRIDYDGYKKFIKLYTGDHSELVGLMELCDIEYFTGINGFVGSVAITKPAIEDDPEEIMLHNHISRKNDYSKNGIAAVFERIFARFGRGNTKITYKKY